jgi:hypothetical protein
MSSAIAAARIASAASARKSHGSGLTVMRSEAHVKSHPATGAVTASSSSSAAVRVTVRERA